MNSPANPPVAISARHLGPVLSLEGNLTKNRQNLVFARNGTGKSFLSRALRALDLHGQGKNISEAAADLVSDEAPDGKGSFSLSMGSYLPGYLTLDRRRNAATATTDGAIFHVFSEDFVTDELRVREFKLDGNVENEISIGSDNIRVKEIDSDLVAQRQIEAQLKSSLKQEFESRSADHLCEQAGVSKRLKEYGELQKISLTDVYQEMPPQAETAFRDLVKQLGKLKAMPTEPVFPEDVAPVQAGEVNLEDLRAILTKETSPSSVSGEIKSKIDRNKHFYQTGLDLLDESQECCPFCAQSVTEGEVLSLIKSYLQYFSDAEERHKEELRKFSVALDRRVNLLKDVEIALARQKKLFDDLKNYIPSMERCHFTSWETEVEEIRGEILSIQSVVKEKEKCLVAPLDFNSAITDSAMARLNQAITENNALVQSLVEAVKRSDSEKKDLQRAACKAFLIEFLIEKWSNIEAIRRISADIDEKKAELRRLQSESPTSDARSRVAETFSRLVAEFFGSKYKFDAKEFSLTRGDLRMTRGPHRTLSEGEKTVLAFCYFIASVHKKVASNRDYEKLFLVFDDPVTSMSYDYVFSIAQTLKNLSISPSGDVSVDPSNLSGKSYQRPWLLIFTHSSYLFNICVTNRVVKENAAFSLQSVGAEHKLSPLNKYIAPFQQQLAHIFYVANGKDADHGTGNSIRSVLEAVGRFCRPDKKELTDFITFLAAEAGITLKSVLINSLSHGTYYDNSPQPDDLKLACRETIEVVERYAPGQIELLRSDGAKAPSHAP